VSHMWGLISGVAQLGTYQRIPQN